MTKLPADHPYRKHAQNLAAVSKGLTQVERIHKDAIRKGDDTAIETVARLHMLTAGIAAEARLRKIYWDPDGFNDRERALLMSVRSQLDRWMAAVEYAFRRHYTVPIHQDVDQFTVGGSPFAQFTTLSGLIQNHLGDIIGDRNRTAHAQWKWHLNSKESQFTGRAASPLNYIQIKARSDLITSIGDLVNILAVSHPTFQRDFGLVYQESQRLAGLLAGSTYPAFAADLRSKRPRVAGPPSGQPR